MIESPFKQQKLTFLGDQRLSTRRKANHDHTDPGVLDADSNAIRLAGACHLHD